MKSKVWKIFAALAVFAMLVASCAPAVTAEPTSAPAVAPTTASVATEAPANTDKTKITMWSHSAGNPTEIAVVEKAIEQFNAESEKYEIVLEAFPQASYNDSVAAASVAGSLPDIIDMDGPTVPNFAWAEYIQPLPLTDADLKTMGILSADVGTYNGKIYSLGQFDVALLIYGRKSILEKYNIRIPTIDNPWTKDEFMAALDTLKASGEFEYPFDPNPGYTGEWWPYAYSPLLQSFGGDLIDRSSYTTAEGKLNGSEALAWGEWFQGLFKNGYANPTPADDQGFLQGKVALWYTGSWSADAVVKQYGDDALFLPAVDFGDGPKIGAGSWQWGISATSPNAEGAWEFIKYLMEPEQVAAMSEATGLIPTTPAAAALTTKYKEGGLYRVFYDMALAYAVVRPPTPGYLVISSAFEQAGSAIRDGGDVQNALDDAVDKIDQDIQDHNNYGFE
ncbi:MAG: sugar ABC transporter substrate-binding protein [Chloroflexota bacterium]